MSGSGARTGMRTNFPVDPIPLCEKRLKVG
jgi:hypothetical protein